MNVFDARVGALRELVEGCETAESITDRASLYSATRFLLEDICKDQAPHSYIREKAFKVGAHVAASLRFGHDHGLSTRRHLESATIELSSLESALVKAR